MISCINGQTSNLIGDSHILEFFILPPKKYGAIQPDVIFHACQITPGHETTKINTLMYVRLRFISNTHRTCLAERMLLERHRSVEY